MKKIQLLKGLLFLASILNISISHSQAPTFEWATSVGKNTTTSMDFCFNYDVIADNVGNVYYTGSYDGPADFDPGPAVYNLPNQGGYISKLDVNGNFVWAKSFVVGGSGNSSNIKLNSVTTDFNGDLYIAGYFSSLIDCDPSGLTANLTGSVDGFLLKLDTDGNYLWAVKIGGGGADDALSVDVDNLSNVFVTGYYSATVDFDPGVGTTSRTSNGLQDIFVVKFDASGNFQWVNSFGGTGDDIGYSIATNGNNDLVVGGDFNGTADFDPSAGVLNKVSNGGTDIFVLKITNNGLLSWIDQIGGSSNDRCRSIDVDNVNNIVFTGIFYGNVDFDPNAGSAILLSTTNTMYISKLEGDGSYIWAKSMLGGAQGLALTIDNLGNIYSTGLNGGTTDFDPGISNYDITSGASTDPFILKLNSSGDFEWAFGFIGSNYGSNWYANLGNSICLDQFGGVIVSGDFTRPVDFDPSVGTYILNSAVNPANVPYQSIFVVKLSECLPISSSISPIACASYTAPDGALYTSTGQYSATIPSIAGCDSVITINLTVNNNATSTISPSICGTYTAPDGAIYTSTGQYFATIPSIAGCDSVITINLTVNNNTSSTISPSVCATYTAPDNQIYTQSGLYSATIPSFAGCDSVITINLTVNQSSVSSQTQTALDSYTWPVNSQTYSSSGIYTAIIPNAAGCDSTITLNLTLSFTGIIELNSGTLTLSPNPTTSKISVKASLELIGKEFSIYDQLGKAVKSGIITSENTEIDLSNLTEGTYLFKIGSEMMESFKIIKQ